MKFKYNPRILAQLGTELIISDEVAFTELLKNAYDANAKRVKVHFLDSIEKLVPKTLLTPLSEDVLSRIKKTSEGGKLIVIEDNGDGMNKQRLEEGFFTVGSDLKEKLKKAEDSAGRKERMTLGDKGLGRLSSQRLADILVVETTSIEEKHINYVEIDWAKFSKELNAEAKEEDLPKSVDAPYTRLWFTGNVAFEKFIDDRRVKQPDLFAEPEEETGIYLQEKIQSSVSFLYSPFESIKEDFDITFYWNDDQIISSFHNESINIAETIHSFQLSTENNQPLLTLKLELRPWYVELTHLRILGKNIFSDRRKSTEFYASLLEKHKDKYQASMTKKESLQDYINKQKEKFNPLYKHALEQIMPIEGKVFTFHREKFRFKLAEDAAKSAGYIDKDEKISSIKDFLNYHNGIKLYRNKFRIANLGDKDNDWLNLQQARTSGQQFFRFELGNVIGYVKIDDFYQKYIKEVSSRQELKETLHATALTTFLRSIFNRAFYDLSSTAYYLTRDILDKEGLIPKNNPEELKRKVDESEGLLKDTLKDLSVFQDGFNEIKNNITLDTPEKIRKVQSIIESLNTQEAALSSNISNSITTLKTAKDTLTLIEERQKESYNNYKLMANGLITEVMTHELHSILLNTKSGTDYNHYIEAIRSYLLEMNKIGLIKDNLKPVSERMDFLHTRIKDLGLFYNFLERTFIKQGTHDDFENENLGDLIEGFRNRMEPRLKSLKTDLVFNEIGDYTWYVPKGTLTHVFYNLIDNSLHWIGERQKRAAYDNQFKFSGRDYIKIEIVNPSILHYLDSGTGVSEEMQYTLFHPFKSGKKEGRGMGLYIVKKLLESFGGNIELLQDTNAYGNRYIFSISIDSEEYE